jgi:hypothetical protein
VFDIRIRTGLPSIPVLLMILLAGSSWSYNLYYANLHSHTSYSDGQSTPRHAYAYARDTAHIQVLAITDHSDMLNSAHWYDTRAQADSATRPGSFVGICGFEWTSSAYGHINVLFSSRYVTTSARSNLLQLYAWLDSQPQEIAQFNHPASGDFDNFAHQRQGDSAMELCEMKTVTQSGRFHLPLDSGWQVGAAANQDNHQADWGAERNLTGIWADSLTPSSILVALRARRTFASMDRTARLRFLANGAWMGSTVNNGNLLFRVIASDPHLRIDRVELVTNHNQVLASHAVGDTNFVDWQTSTRTSSGENRYFFARVVLNDTTWVVSSPVWTAGAEALDDDAGRPARVQFEARPNPSSGSFSFPVEGPCGPGMTLDIFDCAGNLVRSLSVASEPVTWDGTDRNGWRVRPGVYFARLRTSAGIRTARLLLQ